MDIVRGLLEGALNELARLSATIGLWFHNIAADVNDIPLIRGLAGWFQNIGFWFDETSWNFIILRDILLRMYDLAQETLNWDTIKSLLQDWMDWAWEAWVWVKDARDHILKEVDDWWYFARKEVQGWIATVSGMIYDLGDSVYQMVHPVVDWYNSWAPNIPTVEDIIEWFTNWTGNVTGIITTWWQGTLPDIENLIRSWLREYEPFWEGWQDWKESVTEFFSDPEDWLYRAADRIIERFW